MKLCVFDFDSTLMDGETIDILAEAYGKGEDVKAITEQAMRGEIDFFEALTERVKFLEGLAFDIAEHICQSLPLMPGASLTVKTLQERAYKVVIFSGGFRMATGFHGQFLGADADFANFLHHRNGFLTGKVGGEMMTSDAKGVMLERLQSLLRISEEQTVVVGDGANDLAMFAHAGKRIAFNAKPVVQEAADIVIEEKNLAQILQHTP